MFVRVLHYWNHRLTPTAPVSPPPRACSASGSATVPKLFLELHPCRDPTVSVPFMYFLIDNQLTNGFPEAVAHDFSAAGATAFGALLLFVEVRVNATEAKAGAEETRQQLGVQIQNVGTRVENIETKVVGIGATMRNVESRLGGVESMISEVCRAQGMGTNEPATGPKDKKTTGHPTRGNRLPRKTRRRQPSPLIIRP